LAEGDADFACSFDGFSCFLSGLAALSSVFLSVTFLSSTFFSSFLASFYSLAFGGAGAAGLVSDYFASSAF
jgi:hypothetical protein